MCVFCSAHRTRVARVIVIIVVSARPGVGGVAVAIVRGGGRPGRKLITREDIADERKTGIFMILSHGPEVLDRRLQNDRVRK